MRIFEMTDAIFDPVDIKLRFESFENRKCVRGDGVMIFRYQDDAHIEFRNIW